jgi:hypothetical protein
MFTGSIIPSISKTTTYYVRTSTGPDFSVRVPVVASVYPAIGEFVCFAYGCRRMWRGSTYIYCKLFEFSIDGIIKQQMSANREFQTTLKKVKSLALERGMR